MGYDIILTEIASNTGDRLSLDVCISKTNRVSHDKDKEGCGACMRRVIHPIPKYEI